MEALQWSARNAYCMEGDSIVTQSNEQELMPHHLSPPSVSLPPPRRRQGSPSCHPSTGREAEVHGCDGPPGSVRERLIISEQLQGERHGYEHTVRVDGARYAVHSFEVQLRDHILYTKNQHRRNDVPEGRDIGRTIVHARVANITDGG